ncbi:LytR/AlgR family response regulator transcription factor [Heliophilum fasciatum]|uniref:Stage 0 sporulation protein A homolog n=1 Tax=Heliophilum fasciatum TaxID=35700 RepID=A0A4R2S988_9FIRM|nr:LytTR family DNA-binding domain-containing protein [Heliophilum fasciatum]MCW2276636.1 DNA-binding LytR/AlgR family response regulator [Heliophilum fasciatum]TCP68981.1 LytTR family two component transcriptional regulator [Heliophilum fasciatum]
MVIRTFIVDDEAPARRELRFLLESLPDCQIVGDAASGEEALEKLRSLPADVIFLDIHLGDIDGLQVARTLSEEGHLPLIVFATAFDHYALQAFEFHAIDYLLKPFDPRRLTSTWQAIRQRIQNQANLQQKIDELKQWLLHGQPSRPVEAPSPSAPAPNPVSAQPLERIAAQKNGKILLVSAENIRYATVEGRKAVVQVNGERYELHLTLQELEERLDPQLFFRVHRAYLVNISKIREIVPWFNGSYNVILDDRSEIPVSRHYAKEFKEHLGI